jgi:hypothetical protein
MFIPENKDIVLQEKKKNRNVPCKTGHADLKLREN